MLVSVRTFSKINLGLCIGSTRADGFHELRTVYQTVALHDVIHLGLQRGSGIEIRCEDPRVPTDRSNTCWRMVEHARDLLDAPGRVVIQIEKRLPVQGGLGGASGNAVGILLALEIALKKQISFADKLRIAGEVGSDLPLFLIGGTVLGTGRGEEVYPLVDFPAMDCVVALPAVSVSTPQAFKDWDLGLFGAGPRTHETSAVKQSSTRERESDGSSDGARDPNTSTRNGELTLGGSSDRIDRYSRRVSSWLGGLSGVPVSKGRGRAETPLLDLVRTGIENDFEKVVFPKYPELREAKSVLEGAGALYASLSGSGSSVYGLFQSKAKAKAAKAALKNNGIRAVTTRTLTRPQYWNRLQIPA